MRKEPVDIKSIFFEALRKKNAAERVAYLDGACGKDAILRAEVKSLLKSHEKAGDFLSSPDLNPEVTLDSFPLTEGPDTVIGNYKLLERIGEGGMAVVYMAEQEKPLRRRVALKIIKLGMDTKQVIARFEVERQALAVMDHPNIAKVFDAGTTETGRPYFVMELVRGVSISEYCDKNKLSTKERLDLFVQVCNAVQHAHQKGIIHRDIKPSNVMVTLHDGKPVPKVIDFGIAKATSQKLTEKTLFTRYAQMIGTPAYMSPEQAEMSGLDIDTRTDIYSLGVLLYELLTGGPPFGEVQLREAGYLEMQRIILEQEPLRPSTKLSTLGDTLTDVAEHRKASPALLQKLIRGDLDWIVMKSLEKDRTRRYNTAAELVADIERHLNHDPVLAGPPSTIYRLKKFLRKYQTQAIAAATAAVLLACIAVIFVMYIRAVSRGKEAEFLEHKDILSKAMGFRSNGQFQAALDELEPIINSRHIRAEARLLRARLLLDTAAPAQAIHELEGLLNGPSEIAGPAHFLLARIYYESDPDAPGQTKAYRDKWHYHEQQAERLLPDTADTYLLRALNAGTVPKMLDLLNQALELDRGHFDALRQRAYLYHLGLDFRRLLKDAARLIGIRPDNPLGYSLSAIAQRELGQPEEALEDHDKAIMLSPENPQFYDQRRQTYMDLGRYEQALSDAEKSFQLQPDNTYNKEIYHCRVFYALVALGRYKAAQSLFENHLSGFSRTCSYQFPKYVFDMLRSGRSWHPMGDVPKGSAFILMAEAEEVYEQLAAKATYVTDDAFMCDCSADGRFLAYSRGTHGSSCIEIYNIESGETRLLTIPGKDPFWSPDGRYIAYVRNRRVLPLHVITGERTEIAPVTPNEEIWIVKADGSEKPRYLTSGRWPIWKSDSKHIFYSPIETFSLNLISIEEGAMPISKGMCIRSIHFDISPDDKYIVHCYQGFLNITKLSSKSTSHVWIGHGPFSAATWSPDGHRMSLGGKYGDNGLWIYDLQTNAGAQYLSGDIQRSCWISDSGRIGFAINPPKEIWMVDTGSLGQGRSVHEFYQERLNRFNRHIEWNPEWSWAHFERAVCYFYLDDPNKAKDDLEVYVKLREKKETKAQIYTEFVSYMTFIPRQVLYQDVLVELARQAVALEPNDPNHFRALALSNYRAGFYQETINTLNQAIDLGYKGEEIHMLMCMAYWQMNKKALARNWYNKSTFFEKIPTLKRDERIISAGHENYIWMYTILRSQAQLLVSTLVPDK